MKKVMLVLSVTVGIFASPGMASADYSDLTLGSYPGWAYVALLGGR